MRQVLYGLMFLLPIYFLYDPKDEANDIDAEGEDIMLPYELKEEYMILTSLPKNDRDEYIDNRIKELQSMMGENKDVKEKYEVTPLNVKFKKNIGRQVEYYNREELIDLMQGMGFKKLNDYNTGILRRIWLAYNYDQFFWDVHYKTDFPISIIYAYFIMEATFQGIESDLMATYMNPGGIKYTGVGDKIKAYDDCYNKRGKPIKCEFAVFKTYSDMVAGWSNVFNQHRYASCRSYDNAADICKCLYESGYHTANNWNRRAMLSKEYWKLRASFPKQEEAP